MSNEVRCRECMGTGGIERMGHCSYCNGTGRVPGPTISDDDLLAMADKAFGKVVDYDLMGNPITDYRVLTIGAYGPAVRRIVELARQYPVPPKVESLFEALAYGDEGHRSWLKAAIEAHLSNSPAPAYVPSAKDLEIEALKADNADLRRRLDNATEVANDE